jgi:polyisoprenoid-binding protein YceI
MRTLSFFLVSLLSPSLWAAVTTYNVDSSHASIVFRVSHLGYSGVYGMLPGAEGTFQFDEAKPENSKLEVSVKADAVSTHDQKRDDHLRGPDFFNVKQFPKITLKSKSVKKAGEKKYRVEADLTMHGETKPVNFVFDLLKVGKDPWGKDRIGGETKFTIKRSDFKMTYMNKPNELGDSVELIVSLEGVK